MHPRIQINADMWEASYMDNETALQRFLRQAINMAPGARDHYDKEIQKRTGAKGKHLYDIDRGKSRNPQRSTLKVIAEVLGQPFALVIRAADGEEVEPVEAYKPEPDIPPIVGSADGDGSVSLRMVDLDLSMGDGANIDDYVEEGVLDFDANLLRKITKTPAHLLYVARGSGDSMIPTLINGDMMVIDPTRTDLYLQDRIWAISLFGAGGIKRLRPVSQGKVEVISDNPARDNQVVDASDLRILGRVIWIGREV